MRRAIAVFDIDGTLLRGDSSERMFVRYLLSRGELGLTNATRFLCRLLAALPRDRVRATKGNRFYLRGKQSARLRRLAEDCFRRDIAPLISPAARRRMEAHRVSGLEIVLLSGTLDILLRCFGEHLGADRVHGSTLKVSGDCYTGELVGVHPYGAEKAGIVRANYGAPPYDLSSSYAYADHASDLEFLSLFGHPTLVNPGRRLAARAGRMGIPTEIFYSTPLR